MVSMGPLWLGAVGLALAPVEAPAQAGVYCFGADVLGAPANFMFTSDSRDIARQAMAAVFEEIDRLDLILSGHRSDSELAELNRSEGMVVSADLFAVLQQAEAARIRTDGAFDARLGAVERLWRDARDTPPDRASLIRAVHEAGGPIQLDAATRHLVRPKGVTFSIDAIAKGYIIDQALAAAQAAAPLAGVMIDIGGDMRCHGQSGADDYWSVGVSDPRLPFVNGPLISKVQLRDQAIATSGRGPRDRLLDGKLYSSTLASNDGWATAQNISASVVAPTAAEADSLATALLTMEPARGLAMIADAPGIHAQIMSGNGQLHRSSDWSSLDDQVQFQRIANPSTTKAVRSGGGNAAAKSRSATPPGPSIGKSGWVIDWALQVIYEAPEANVSRREADFRTPYMAMWISDKNNRPIRTLTLVGKDPDWQRENHIWWSLYGAQAPRLIQLRSSATALSGRYPTFWPGIDDAWNFVPAGEYILHIETSRERGEHTHRSIPLTLGNKPFETQITPTAEGGGLKIVYGKRA
jgi:thiamine biosynthesis lipoprotein